MGGPLLSGVSAGRILLGALLLGLLFSIGVSSSLGLRPVSKNAGPSSRGPPGNVTHDPTAAYLQGSRVKLATGDVRGPWFSFFRHHRTAASAGIHATKLPDCQPSPLPRARTGALGASLRTPAQRGQGSDFVATSGASQCETNQVGHSRSKQQRQRDGNKSDRPKDCIRFAGKVIACLPGGKFKVQLDAASAATAATASGVSTAFGEALVAPEGLQGKVLMCSLSGKLRIHRVYVHLHDCVVIETHPLSPHEARIVFRVKENPTGYTGKEQDKCSGGSISNGRCTF
ncbi:hypothetical protein cyc_04781 [Cyclospora cayetanensis]|uniref:S1-like domain-containing protein n=1 Tax=Cyclospora cayetanensis TaxID=88456 RepID=A0A1D3CVY1_9EIME|nr:hypothetical protein cyc_04781 [Cyclospora cayetanensis]